MWSSAWYWCNVTALVVCLLAQVKRPTQSLWYAASVVASLCQSHVSVMHGQMAESQPESAVRHLTFITRLHLCLHDWWREGGNKCLCGKQMRERMQPTWKIRSMKFILLSPSLHSLNHVKLQTKWRKGFFASLVLYFTWKDASLTRSGSLLFFHFWQHFSCAWIGYYNKKASYTTL